MASNYYICIVAWFNSTVKMRFLSKKGILYIVFAAISVAASAQDYVRPTPQTSFGDDPYNNNRTTPKNDYGRRRKFNISLAMGAAVPMGDFGSNNVKGSFWDFTSPDSTRLQGFAQTGFHFEISMSYMFNDNFGIMAMLSGNSNSFDINTFSATVGYETSTTDDYYTGEYLIGPCFTYPGGESRFNVKGYAMIGAIETNYPELNFAFNDTLSAVIDFNGGSGFGYCLGGGVSYAITPSTEIFFNVSYTSSTITYSSWTETYNSPGYYPYTFSHYTDVTSMKTGILKPVIGVNFRF